MAAGATAAPMLLVSLLSFWGARSGGGGSRPLLAGAQQQHQSSNLVGGGKRGRGVRGGKWEGTGAFQDPSMAAAAAAVTESRGGTSLAGAGASASATTARTVPADGDYLTPADFEGPRIRSERRTPGHDSRKYSGFSGGVVDIVGGGSGGSGGDAESDGREGGPPSRESPNVSHGLLPASGDRLPDDGRDHSGGWHDERCWSDHETGRHRCQANVFLFGVSKCGTTSLASWMAHHPALQWVSNLHKIGRVAEEAHVLDEMKKEGFQQMLGQGPAGKYGQTAPFAEESDKVIDYTPHCSIKAEVPYRILDIYGEAARDGSNKYLIQLRDPVARVISSWTSKFDLLSLEEGFAEGDSVGDTRSLAEAIQQGEHGMAALSDCEGKERRLAAPSWDPERQKVMELERCPMRNFLGHSHGLYWAHVAKGMYARQLERWFTLVGRENIKVTFLEETAADPVGALASIFEFIGLDLLDEEGEKGLPNREAWESVVATIHNETDEERKTILDQQVTPELLQSMRDFFAPHNAELEELLGRPLPDNWSTVASGSH